MKKSLKIFTAIVILALLSGFAPAKEKATTAKADCCGIPTCPPLCP